MYFVTEHNSKLLGAAVILMHRCANEEVMKFNGSGSKFLVITPRCNLTYSIGTGAGLKKKNSEKWACLIKIQTYLAPCLGEFVCISGLSVLQI